MKKPMSKNSRNDFCMQRAAGGGKAVAKMIPNGLAREARNHRRVGAYGEPARYQPK